MDCFSSPKCSLPFPNPPPIQEKHQHTFPNTVGPSKVIFWESKGCSYLKLATYCQLLTPGVQMDSSHGVWIHVNDIVLCFVTTIVSLLRK